jgi:AraC-like DNA-binding protein
MDPILIVDIGRTLFIGDVDEVAEHRAMIPVLGAGLDAPFAITREGVTSLHRVALVDAEVSRTVRSFGKRLAVMPIDPVTLGAAPLQEQQTLDPLRALAEGYDPDAWLALERATGLSRVRTDLPPKLVDAARCIAASADENQPVEHVCERVGLSASRLQHLFRRHFGTSMRTYRRWWRFWQVMRSMREGASLTDAAVKAGFYDAPHFNHAFKAAFGVTPSFVFSPRLRIYVL